MKIHKHGVLDITFNHQAFTRFHVRLVRNLYFFMKAAFLSPAAETKHVTNLIAAKR